MEVSCPDMMCGRLMERVLAKNLQEADIMEKNISIISRLKKIAITSLDLGKEIVKDKATHAANSLRDSRAGHLAEATRQRFDNAMNKFNGQSPQTAEKPGRSPATLQRPPASGKRHLGAKKYSAKTARLTPH